MKSYPLIFLCLACLFASGCCGTRAQQVNALQRENSQLDGLLWEMQFELEALEEKNAELTQRLEATDEADRDPKVSVPRRPRKIVDEPTEAAPFNPGEFRPPVIEFPSEPTPEGTIPGSLLPDGSGSGLLPAPGESNLRPQPSADVSTTAYEQPAVPEPTTEAVPVDEVSLDSSRIARIELASLIGTLNLDDKYGDDGLVIVVEPWDKSDQMLADAADVSVALIDPDEPAASARFAQWEFPAQETARLFRDGDLPGMHLELPWPGDPPRHDRLHLFVRYTTSDGRRLETDSLVEVELGGQGRWVATESPRVRPYEQVIVPASEIPVLQQPMAAAGDTATEDAANVPGNSPVHTVSLPRTRSEEPELMPQPPRETPPEPLLESKPRPVKAEPTPAAAPEPPARRRPTWSPDRPW